MSPIFILFFASLFAIIIMIGRKLFILKGEQSSNIYLRGEEVLFEVPYAKEIKNVTITNIKKYGRLSLVTTLRFYIRSNIFLKNKYDEAILKIKNKKVASRKGDSLSERQVSKFLRAISEYKHKIREIKRKINEEEKGS